MLITKTNSEKVTLEVFRNEILAACQPGKKTLNVEGFSQAERLAAARISKKILN